MKEILFTSSILILVLGLLRYLLRGRINLHLQYALWLLVAVRLLVPLSSGCTMECAQRCAPGNRHGNHSLCLLSWNHHLTARPGHRLDG